MPILPPPTRPRSHSPPMTMHSIAQAMLPEFDHEMANTRRVLERTPEERADWTPHHKSMSLGSLAVHLATLPAFASMALTQSESDMNPPGGTPYRSPEWSGREAMLQMFDAAAGDARATLAGSSDADLMETWTFKYGGQTIFSLPRVAVMRSFVLNHIIHHRGQFTVYLRLNDVAIPGMYGPSADE